MKNKIVLPFNYQNDNRDRYVQTLQKAAATQSDVVLFTCLPEDTYEEEIAKVYENLLELNGFFQTIYGGWEQPNFGIERIIQRGNFEEKLVEYLNSCPSTDLMIQYRVTKVKRD